MTARKKYYKMILSAMFLTLSLVLPFFTGQLQQLGNALCPMHIPVLLCGFFCGPVWGLVIGLLAPLLRFIIFAAPPIMPIGLAMCFELAAYGFVSGLLHGLLPPKRQYIYVSLISAMISGRIIWGIARLLISGAGNSEFGWTAFISGAILNAIPGIILQIVLVPVLVMTLEKSV